MLRKMIFCVVVASVLALWTAAGWTMSELSGVTLERLGNKIVVHMSVDGGAVPILKYDEAGKTMRVTLNGTSLGENAPGGSMLAESDIPWLSAIEFEESDSGAVVVFRLGGKANPLDFIISSGFDEVQAVIYTDGTTGFTESVPHSPPPSSRIREVELPVPSVEAETPDASGQTGDAVLSTETPPQLAAPPFVVEEKMPRPPLMLRDGGELYTSLFGVGGSGEQEKSFRYGASPIMLKVDRAPLAQVLGMLIEATPYNVIISDAVGEQTVSALTLDNISLFEALDLLTKSYNLSYVVEFNTIVIGQKDTLEANFGKLITKTFWLDYADGESIKLVLMGMGLAREGNVQVYNGETTYLDVSGASSLSGGTGGITIGTRDIKLMESLISTARRNMLVITETEERMTRISQVVADLDKKPRQIRLETEIIEVSETGERKLGLDLHDAAGFAQIPTSFFEATDPNFAVEGAVESFKLQQFVRDPLSFRVTLHHLIEDGDARVLAKPNIMAIDGTQSIYFAGQEIPYISQPAQSQGTTFTPAQVEFKTVGITLNFKPRVDRDGNISIEVNPQVSSLIAFIDLGQGALAPHTQTRQATATVRVKSGDVFILGGMIAEEERESFKKVPFLHKLPLFGQLFQTKEFRSQKSEIIVIIRPVIEE